MKNCTAIILNSLGFVQKKPYCWRFLAAVGGEVMFFKKRKHI